jgi:hypothetical protein
VKYCSKCIMPEIYPGISFNKEGICNLCLDYRPHHEYLGKEKLIEVLNSAVKTGAYDCVVPISGGKDSTFILYYAVKELKLNPIAVSYDSGFQTEIAKENLRNACKILGVPLEVVTSPGDIQSKLLKESLLVSKSVGYLTDFCGNCEAILRMVSMNTARAHGVPFVLWGASALETLSNENYTEYRSPGTDTTVPSFSFLRRLWLRFNVVLQNPRMLSRIPKKLYPYMGYYSIRYNMYSILQRYELNFSAQYALRPHTVPAFSETNPMFIHYFDYIPWDSIGSIKILERELNWKHPIDKVSRFDCLIHPLANYQYLKKYGISYDGINFCNYIRENRMSREEVATKEQEVIDSVERECKELSIRVGLKNYTMPSDIQHTLITKTRRVE